MPVDLKAEIARLAIKIKRHEMMLHKQRGDEYTIKFPLRVEQDLYLEGFRSMTDIYFTSLKMFLEELIGEDIYTEKGEDGDVAWCIYNRYE